MLKNIAPVKKSWTFLLTICLFFCMSSFSFAQRQTGSLTGTVHELEGQPIPGVNITVSSPSLIGSSLTTFTDKEGNYNFPALPPGLYQIQAELQNFQTMIRREIRIYIGTTIAVNFNLEMIRTSESVEVSAKPPLLDAKSTNTSQIIPPHVIENIPKPLRYIDLLSLTPGVEDLDLSAYGAAGDRANGYWIDGVNAASPRSGQIFVAIDYNWIEEAQILGIGASAEYGGFTGVLANFVTRSGGNHFHGLVETFFENEALVSENIPGNESEQSFSFYQTTLQLGGPILRDKLWFFAGFGNTYNETQPLGYDGTTIERIPRFITKLTYKINENNTLQGFGYWDSRHISDQIVGFIPSQILPEAAGKDEGWATSWNASWTSMFTPQTLLEARFGGWYADAKTLPKNGQIPGHFEFTSGVFSDNLYFTDFRTRLRSQANASVSHYATDFIGNHDFKFGVEFERSRNTENYYYTGGMYYIDYYGAPYYRYISEGYDTTNHVNRVSSYAQDNWSIGDRLTLSLGLRWDHNRGKTERGSVYGTDPVAPRLGFTYQLGSSGSTVIKAHYGEYYEGFFDAYFQQLFDHPFKIGEFFEEGQWIEGGRTRPVFSVDPDLRQPGVRQFTAGFDQLLPADISFGAHYIYRKWHDILQVENISGVFEEVPFVNPINGETSLLFNQLNPGQNELLITNPSNLFRRYDGLEIFASKRFSDNISVNGSFVISKARGNIDNTQSTYIYRELPRRPGDPNSNINADGRLTNDPTYEFKVIGIFSLPLGINASSYFRHLTGDTWTPILQTGLNQGLVRFFGEPRGSERLPSRNVFDIRLEKQFQIGPGRLLFTGDIFNLFNTGYVLAVNPNFQQKNGYLEPRIYTLPREIRLGIRYAF